MTVAEFFYKNYSHHPFKIIKPDGTEVKYNPNLTLDENIKTWETLTIIKHERKRITEKYYDMFSVVKTPHTRLFDILYISD